MSFSALAIALAAATSLAGGPAPLPIAATLALAEAADLAVQPLAAGQSAEALAKLERASAADPRDPAVLINLGIAYAQAGEDDKARAAFEAAMACEEAVDLDTADGQVTDSRRLARKALKMLARGEFRPATAPAERLTRRD